MIDTVLGIEIDIFCLKIKKVQEIILTRIPKTKRL